ncbi:hypothetical protein [Natrinema sp. 74]|uniref:hypothetical protein n=1 Tax=Natrinema sp. 74 TaxID=3384159 RepID=UPI0038D4DE5F
MYAWVAEPVGSLSPSDFELAPDVPYDIDVKGSAVSGHVVAPTDVPGVESSYELVQDGEIIGVIDPQDVLQDITYDGKQALKYRPGSGGVDWDGDLPSESPENLPACYGRALQLRRKAPDDHGNTHKVNLMAAMCGLAAGYDAEDVAGHMCDEYAPGGDSSSADEEETKYQVDHIAGMMESGRYAPPSLSTLRGYGVLDEGESCGDSCPIGKHDTRSPSEREAAETVAEFTAEFNPVEDRPEEPDLSDKDDDEELSEEEEEALAEWPSGSEIKAVRDAIPRLTDDDYDAIKEPLAARLDGSSCALLDRHRTLTRKLWDARTDIVNYDGKLVKASSSGWASCTTLLNFELDVTSLLSVQGEDRMANVEVRPEEPTESEFELQIEPRVFNDARRFKDEVLAKRFSTTIESNRAETDVMDLLRKYISRQDVPNLAGQKSMGLARSGDEFVTPNGVLGVDGWVDEPDTVFVEQDAASERKFEANPGDHDVDEIVNGDVAEMLELFTRTRDPERFVPVLGWWFAAPHRERIVDTSGSMNLLFITGESGVGKSGTLKVLQRLFGMEEKPFSATDTKFAQIKTFSSSNGVPIWLDEYKTSEMPDWQQSNLHELLRKVATGGVEQRGRADQSTVEYHLKAPVCVSGETSLRGSAEQRRAISTTFTNAPTESGAPEYQRFKELAGDAVTDEDGNVTFPDANYGLEQHAVKYYQYVAGMSDDEFEDAWFSAREYVSAKLAEWDTELDDLEVQGLQTVAFGFRVMRSFAEEVGADLSNLPSEDDLDDALRYVADVEGDGRETHIDQFTQLVQRAAVADYLEKGTHYTVVRAGKAGEELRVNVNQSFDAVSKYIRDHDLNEDLLGSAKDYTDRFGEAEEQDTYVACTSQPTTGVGRAVGILTDRAEDAIAAFDIRAFLDSDDFDSEFDPELVGDDDDDDPDASPVAGLSANDGTGYETVTVTVTDWETPDHPAIEARGTVKDTSTAIKVVDFEDGSPDAIEEGDTYRLTNVQVDEYDGKTQLLIDAGTTEFQSIQPGVGWTDSEEPGDGQETLDGASEAAESQQESVLTDGGDTDGNSPSIDADVQRDRVMELKDIIETVEDKHEDGAPVDGVQERAVDAGLSEDKFGHELAKLKKQGEVYEPSEDRLRTV